MLGIVIHVFLTNVIPSEHISGGWQIQFCFILMLEQKQNGRHCEKLGIFRMVVNH